MNIIIWIQSINSLNFSRAINVLARQYGNINFIGTVQNITPPPSNSPIVINNKPIPVVLKEDLSSINYDLIVVVGQNASLVPILKEAEKLKINPDKVVLDRTICIPGFTLERYNKLRHSKLSIISINCWSGFVYHAFGLEFLSPTINMFFKEEGFLKFSSNLRKYMDMEMRFYKTEFEPHAHYDYPVMLLGDIELHMNHYQDVGVDGARQKWEERRLKINWYNLLVMTFSEKPEVLEIFDKLPFAKKVCFVPFKTDLDSGFYIEPEIIRGREFYEPVNETPFGIMNYDIWDLLLYGKKTPIKLNLQN